jgi:hypothetical protein
MPSVRSVRRVGEPLQDLPDVGQLTSLGDHGIANR